MSKKEFLTKIEECYNAYQEAQKLKCTCSGMAYQIQGCYCGWENKIHNAEQDIFKTLEEYFSKGE